MNRKKIFQFALAMIVGAGIVLLYLLVRDSFEIALPSWPVSILAVVTALFLSVFVHELGHLFAGFFQKFQFHMFTVGPFKVEKTDSGFRPGFNLNLNVAGGLTLMVPTSETFNRSEYAWFIAGGPIASFLFFGVLAAVAFTVNSVHNAEGVPNTIIYFSWLTAVISLGVGATALFPDEENGLETDGTHLKDLFRGGKKALIKQYVMQLYSSTFNGTRPRDYDAEILAKLNRATEEQKNNNSIITKLFIYIHLLDKDEIDKAGEIINKLTTTAEEIKNELLNPTIFLEKSFFEAYYNDNIETAEQYFEKGKKGYSEKGTLKRVKAILFLKKGELDSAKTTAEQAFKVLNNSYDKGGAKWEKELLEKALKESGISLNS